jgi:hypothetical protein
MTETEMKEDEKGKKHAPKGTDVDRVEEPSEESVPASDAPSGAVATEQERGGTKRNPPDTQGCATSFIMQERGEIEGLCGELQRDPKEEYVQPEKEKEAGGEG